MAKLFKRSWIICRIGTFREAAGLRQEDLAKALGVSRQTIIAIEGHKRLPSIQLALKMADYFETSMDNLFIVQKGA